MLRLGCVKLVAATRRLAVFINGCAPCKHGRPRGTLIKVPRCQRHRETAMLQRARYRAIYLSDRPHFLLALVKAVAEIAKQSIALPGT